MVSVVLRKLGLAACVLGVLGAFLSLPASTTAQQSLPQEGGPEDSSSTLSAEEIVQNEETEKAVQAIMAEGIKAVPLSASASLHNPGFDNNDWYEFNDRYGNYLTGSWLPDDDNNSKNNIPLSSRQDWRLWYLKGTRILKATPESTYKLYEEGVHITSYGSFYTGRHFGGIYQVIYNTTPCLEYQFQAYAQARFEPPEGDNTTPPDDWVRALRVGIDRVGMSLPTDDPALDGNPDSNNGFPSTTVWGAAGTSKWAYSPVSVTAEAWADKIAVFTLDDVYGGGATKVLWDTASLVEVTGTKIYNPELHASTSGLTEPQYNLSNSTVTWTSTYSGISQVYYRVKSTPVSTPTATLSYSVYIPLVSSTSPWFYTPLNKTVSNYHSATLSGLTSGYTYEYFVVTKGLFGGVCTTWASSKQEFVAP